MDFTTWVNAQADADERNGVQRDRDSWRRLAWNAAVESAAKVLEMRGETDAANAVRFNLVTP